MKQLASRIVIGFLVGILAAIVCGTFWPMVIDVAFSLVLLVMFCGFLCDKGTRHIGFYEFLYNVASWTVPFLLALGVHWIATHFRIMGI